jgi:lysophospholipase L1-like esterase
MTEYRPETPAGGSGPTQLASKALSSSKDARGIRGAIKHCFVFALCTVFIFFVLEGFCSSLLALLKLHENIVHARASHYHTQFDKQLGWANIPNYYEKNYFNPGVYVRINSQGFRSSGPFDAKVPPNKLRIVCVGDSMTFGTGVDNDHTWCQQLASIDHRFEAINAGVPGYGVDQMYLHYLRDAAWLDHDVMILAVIGDDFRRMQLKTFSEYAKPTLALHEGQLVVDNVPSPRTSRFGSVVRRYGLIDPILQLSTARVEGWVFQKLLPTPATDNPTSTQEEQIATKVIEALQAINKRKNSVLMLVYLPTEEELVSNDSRRTWRHFLHDEAAATGIVLVDFGEIMRQLPADEVQEFYIAPGAQSLYPPAEGHFTDEGNAYVAQKLYGLLMTISELSGKISAMREQETW